MSSPGHRQHSWGSPRTPQWFSSLALSTSRPLQKGGLLGQLLAPSGPPTLLPKQAGESLRVHRNGLRAGATVCYSANTRPPVQAALGSSHSHLETLGGPLPPESPPCRKKGTGPRWTDRSVGMRLSLDLPESSQGQRVANRVEAVGNMVLQHRYRADPTG